MIGVIEDDLCIVFKVLVFDFFFGLGFFFFEVSKNRFKRFRKKIV